MQASSSNLNDVKKVVVIGPECTGKSDLSKYLAEYFKTVWVEEYARAYLNRLTLPYEKVDLTKIAHGQARMEDEWIIDASNVLICDTNALVVKVWSEFKYGECDKEVLRLLDERTYDLYLLTYVDVPWQDDPLREHPDKREYFWNIFKTELEKRKANVVDIRGERDDRRKKSVDAIQKLLGQIPA
jgi:NadR type nicotinamide-nucleotide adenylyltransferase